MGLRIVVPEVWFPLFVCSQPLASLVPFLVRCMVRANLITLGVCVEPGRYKVMLVIISRHNVIMSDDY